MSESRSLCCQGVRSKTRKSETLVGKDVHIDNAYVHLSGYAWRNGTAIAAKMKRQIAESRIGRGPFPECTTLT